MTVWLKISLLKSFQLNMGQSGLEIKRHCMFDTTHSRGLIYSIYLIREEVTSMWCSTKWTNCPSGRDCFHRDPERSLFMKDLMLRKGDFMLLWWKQSANYVHQNLAFDLNNQTFTCLFITSSKDPVWYTGTAAVDARVEKLEYFLLKTVTDSACMF